MTLYHVVGAGIAGLVAAISLAEAGRAVCLWEAGPQAGGRVRSFADQHFGHMLDNGAHLLLSGNQTVLELLARAGGADGLIMPGDGRINLHDRQSGAVHCLRPGGWNGLRLGDVLGLVKLLRSGAETSVADCLASTPAWQRLWQPMAVAALNTPPQQAIAPALAAILRASLLRGAAASRPLFPRRGWSVDVIDPLLAYFRRLGGIWRPGCRLTKLERHGGACWLQFQGETALAEMPVILAVPALAAHGLLPDLSVPQRHHAIVNLHLACPGRRVPGFAGLIGGRAEWVFWRDDVITVTISAADNYIPDWLTEIRADLAWLLPRCSVPVPLARAPQRLVREKRASFAADAANWARRPSPSAAGPGVILAGDWVQTGLPGTIEGAAQSGYRAARLLLVACGLAGALTDRNDINLGKPVWK